LNDLLSPPLRVALFSDAFHEANGVATLSRQLAEFAHSRNLPFLVVRGSDQTLLSRSESLETLELKRGPAAFPLDKGLYCDPLLTRYRKLAREQLCSFKADLVHITGPGDLGFLGLLVAHDLKIPLVASWHTNLHEYMSRRLDGFLSFVPQALRHRAARAAEKQSLRGLLRFYRLARFTLAPNETMVNLLHRNSSRPSFLMAHGVDLAAYSPSPGSHPHPFVIGYVGRLTLEKNVRFFAQLERDLLAAGERDFQFLLVGEGGQRDWLKRHVKHALLPGILRGRELAAAYGKMDVFVFPSRTDTFGLVLLEAMASGLPVVVSPETGARVEIEHGSSGFLTENFSESVLELMRNSAKRTAMSLAARRFACSKSWNGVFEDLYQTYEAGLRAGGLGRCCRIA
jgi:glycosyltransferase involved in cell wall biosynthesis